MWVVLPVLVESAGLHPCWSPGVIGRTSTSADSRSLKNTVDPVGSGSGSGQNQNHVVATCLRISKQLNSLLSWRRRPQEAEASDPRPGSVKLGFGFLPERRSTGRVPDVS